MIRLSTPFVVALMLVLVGSLQPLHPAQATDTSAGREAVCMLPPDPGPCEGICPRYYYDPCSGQCELFIWGCCEGNANNFETLAECEAACPPEHDPCFLPPDVGPCDGICPRFYFDPCTGQCETFIWGCCGGNANNFETIAECEAACPPKNTCPCDCEDPPDGTVDVGDFLALLAQWGGPGSCDCGDTLDVVVDIIDFLSMLANWGPCP
jgi:hypothetical protein